MAPILEISDLTVRYRTVKGDSTAVDGVDLTVARGEIVGIAGESGCGKTTLASSILRLLRPPGYVAGGSAKFFATPGDPIDLLSVDERRVRAVRWSHLAYLPQGSMNSLNPVMKVKDQFLDVMQLHMAGVGQKEIEARIPDLLTQVGLDPAVGRMYAHELSGGMKQRVIMALAVALQPDLLIADEPTTALDVTIQRVVIQNLSELRERFGLAMVVITHDMGVHAQLVDRVAMMYQGKVVEVGDVHQMFKAPHHGYTTQLIQSIPTLEVGQGRRQAAGVAAVSVATAGVATAGVATAGVATAGVATARKAVEPSADVKLIGIEQVTQIFPGRGGTKMRAVNNVSFELQSQPAEIVSLVGASGSGKSTVARILLGLQKPTAGRATYLGKDIAKLSRSEYRAFRADVQPVFQDPYSIFNPIYKVDRVFWKAIKKFKLARKKSDGIEIIRASLEAVKLDPDHVLGRFPHQLSGGQRQRLMLARVHMLRPAFIIADEPVSMLDAHIRRAFLEVIGDFRERYHMTTLFITHDLSTVAFLGGEMMTMYHGQIVEKGPVEKLLGDPEHEYTKLLVASVPVPDPDRRWQDRVELVKGRPKLVPATESGPAGTNDGASGQANGGGVTGTPAVSSSGTAS